MRYYGLTLQVKLQHNSGGVHCVYPKPSTGADQQGTIVDKASFTSTYQVGQQGWLLGQPDIMLVLRCWQALSSSLQAAKAAAIRLAHAKSVSIHQSKQLKPLIFQGRCCPPMAEPVCKQELYTVMPSIVVCVCGESLFACRLAQSGPATILPPPRTFYPSHPRQPSQVGQS